MPKVSVLIPAYNAMAFLPETLDSLLHQTFTDFEVIIINDGSTDHIEQWATQLTDTRVRLVSQSNQGGASARNTGLTHAQGEYIAFLDADDLWAPTKLAKQVQCLDQHPAIGLVYTWLAFIDENGRSIDGKVLKNHAEGDVWQTLTARNIVGCGSVAMARRCCHDAVGLFDLTLPFSVAADWDMWLRIAARYPFKVIKEPLVYYRSHPNNLSRKWEVAQQNYNLVIEKAFASAPAHLLPLKNRSYALHRLQVAWKALQNLDGAYTQAQQFQQQARLHDPRIRYSWEYLRLSLVITLIRLFGLNGYKTLKNVFYAPRSMMRPSQPSVSAGLSAADHYHAR